MPINNQKGFSLVEIIASLGVLGIIIVAAMKMGSIQSQSKVSSQGASDIVKTMASIDGIIKEPLSCAKNFQGKKVGVNAKIDKLVNEAGDILYEVGKPILSGAYSLEEIKIGSYNALTGRVDISLNFTLNKKALAISNLDRVVYIYPNVESGEIKDCLKNIEDRAQGVMTQMCYSYNEDGNCDYEILLEEAKKDFCESKPWLVYDTSSKKCVILDADKSCGAEFAKGYDADGNLDCMTIDMSALPSS